jgi:histidinol-phosphate aminotransferase
MNFADLTRREIAALPVYQPGKPIELLAREHGIDAASIIKLASNENPLGPSPKVVEAVRQAAGSMAFYPDNSGFELVRALCVKRAHAPEQITLGAGSNEIFYCLADLFAGPGVEVVVGEYAFISYRIAALLAGAQVVSVPMPGLRHDLQAMRDAVTEHTRLVFLPNPNNPTGTALPFDAVAEFARSLPEWVVFCYDEAYAEYQPDCLDVQGLIDDGVKIIATRTFSKVYGLAGLRIGYGFSAPELAGLLNRVRAPFNTGSLAQAAAIAALADDAWVQRSLEVNDQGRAQLEAGLGRLGIEPFGEQGNFLLFAHPEADRLSRELQQKGVIIRPLAGYGLPQYLRVSIGTESWNDRFLSSLSAILR